MNVVGVDGLGGMKGNRVGLVWSGNNPWVQRYEGQLQICSELCLFTLVIILVFDILPFVSK